MLDKHMPVQTANNTELPLHTNHMTIHTANNTELHLHTISSSISVFIFRHKFTCYITCKYS